MTTTTATPTTPAATLSAPRPAPAYVPAWALYVYDERAFLTFDVRIQASATCRTAGQLARLVALQDRLNDRRARRADADARATCLAIDRRP